MVDTIAATTAGLRTLGNAEGGYEDNLRLVHHHLMSVVKLLRQARFTNAAVADRLLAEWAQLSQVAVLAHDTGEHGQSQRYFTSGLHAAHTAGDRSVGVYLLVNMSGTAVHRGRLADGIDLGRAARDAVELANAAHEAARTTPAAVRALAVSRFTLAHAAAGNTRGFHVAADEARALLDTPGALGTRPSYLTWFGPDASEGELAQSALTLASATSHKATACSTVRRRCSAAPPPIPPAHRAAPCITPRGCPGRTSRPATWTGRYPPGSPHCVGCPPCAPAVARWCYAGWKPTSPPCHPPTARRLSDPCKTSSAPPTPPEPSVSRNSDHRILTAPPSAQAAIPERGAGVLRSLTSATGASAT